MRLRVVSVAVLAVLGIAACGGDPAAPLALEQRVPGEAEAPGSQPDPVETRRTAASLDELAAIMTDQLITATEEDADRVGQAGFVSAILDARYFPAEPGGGHSRDLPHVVTMVAQFETEAGAIDAIDLLHSDGLEPCPETCAFDIAEFEVEGIPGAQGIQRIASQERIDQVGDTGPPRAEYAVLFADGSFAYRVSLFGSPDEVSEEEAEGIATRLYQRVHDAPPSP